MGRWRSRKCPGCWNQGERDAAGGGEEADVYRCRDPDCRVDTFFGAKIEDWGDLVDA